MEPRHDQARQFLALAHQHHHVSGRGAARLAFRFALDQREAVIEPVAHLPRDPLSHLAIPAREPAFGALIGRLAFLAIATLAADHAPERDLTGALLPNVRFGRRGEPQPFMAHYANSLVDEFEDRPGRAEALAQVEVLQGPPCPAAALFGQVGGGIAHHVVDPRLGLGEVFRAGALEPEDRLLVIADYEQRAQLVVACALAGEELVSQRADDLPLRRVGILRLVNQDVIELPVQLVADPFGEVVAGQELRRLANLVIEIDEPSPRLGRFPGQRELAPDFQRRNQEIDQLQQGAALLHRHGAIEHGEGRFLEAAFQLAQRLAVLGQALLGEELLVQGVKACQPLRRAAFQPAADQRRDLGTGRGLPRCIGRKAALQGIGIEHPVAAQVEQVFRPGIGGQAEQAMDAVLHRWLPSARPFPRLTRGGTAQQPGGDLLRPHPHRKPRQGIERRRVVRPFGHQQQVGQDLAQQQVAVAVLHRLDARQQPRLIGEGGQQPLRKGVDRIDPQPPARAIEHGGKQLAGTGHGLRPMVRPDRQQLFGQRRRIKPHPARQHLVDARGHFGRPGLGESQAQDLIGPHRRFKQQPQHAGRQHLGLARAGRGREPDDFGRLNRRALFVSQGKHAAHASGSPRACHSSSRISWS